MEIVKVNNEWRVVLISDGEILFCGTEYECEDYVYSIHMKMMGL